MIAQFQAEVERLVSAVASRSRKTSSSAVARVGRAGRIRGSCKSFDEDEHK